MKSLERISYRIGFPLVLFPTSSWSEITFELFCILHAHPSKPWIVVHESAAPTFPQM